MTSRIAAVVVLALAGLFIAAGVTFAASRLVSQPIGLSYHQRSLDDSLAPTRTITVTKTITTIGSTGKTSTTTSAPAASSTTTDSVSGSGSSTGAATSAPKAPSSQKSVGGNAEGTTTTEQPTYSDGHNDGDHDD